MKQLIILMVCLVFLASPSYAYMYNQTLGTLTVGTGSTQMTMYFLNITTNTSFVLNNITKNATSTAARFYIFNGTSGVLINSWAFSGEVATANYTMGANNRYMLVISNYSGAGTTHYYSNSASYPYFAKFFNFTSGGYSTTGATPFVVEATRWYEFYNITYSDITPPTTPSSITLYINNGVGNITTSCGPSNNNYTAQINVTGLPVSILYNGSIANTNITIANWYSQLIAGYWNITANFSGNATHTASRTTLYHNITLGTATADINFNPLNDTYCVGDIVNISCNSTALEDGVDLFINGAPISNPYNLNLTEPDIINVLCNWTAGDCYAAGSASTNLYVYDCSPQPTPTPNASFNMSADCCPIYTLFCGDNQTLVQMWNTTLGISYAYQTCANGCDNKTGSCSYPPIYQGFISFAVIIAFIIILLGLDKVLKR